MRGPKGPRIVFFEKGSLPRARERNAVRATLALLASALVSTIVLPVCAFASGSPAAKPTASPPPEIIHLITTPLCHRLHDKVRPAVAMILENDANIAKSLPQFKNYGIGAFGSYERAFGDYGPPSYDSINVNSPASRMALQRMSYLVSPIAQNLIAAQKLLDDASLLVPTGNASDDRQLATIKRQLLETVADQSAALDLINGFVATQQMGDLQHAGQTYLSAITGTGLSTPIRTPSTPFPGMVDPSDPGIPQNPYAIDPTAVPGLSVGYNPLNRLVDGLKWVQDQTQEKENAAAATVMSALTSCSRSPVSATFAVSVPRARTVRRNRKSSFSVVW